MSEDKNSGFLEWFDPDVHDLYNFPEEAMEEAWNAATEKAEAELQEKLRQQREACLEAVDNLDYYESGCPEDHMNAILNAKIDNNGDEG